MHSKPSSILKISESDAVGLNENNPNRSFQNPKKSTTKNFMSPTISAASKATLPRKKILAERNEASGSILSDAHFSKTPQDAKSPADVGINGSDGPLCRTTPLSYRASESEGDDQNSVPDSSSRPYDPLTNYLSPRPKFLRYNPNRRREIFLLKENEIEDGNDRLSIGRSVSFESQNAGDEDGARDTSSQGGSVQPEDEEIVEDEEDIEEVEEQRGWSLKGVLNTLFVFVLLVLSTSYISSMNSPSPTPSPAMEAIEGIKDGYLKIQSHIFGAASVKGLEDGLSQAIEGVQNGYLKFQSHMFGATSVKNSESGSEFMEQQEDRKMGLIEANQGAVDGEVAGDENGESLWPGNGKTLDVSDRMAENLEFQEKTAEKLEAFQDDPIQTPEPVVPGIAEKIGEFEGGVTEPVETDSIPKVVIWASIFAIIVAPLVLGFHLKRKNSEKGFTHDKSSVVVVPPNEGEDHIEKVESYADPSVEEASQEFSQSRAPTVELLGEYVVGEVCSTPKIYSMKSRMMMEGEESNHYSVSQEKGDSFDSYSHTSDSLSSFHHGFPSYGSFTAEKSDGRDGEVKKVVTTPVRRSSRIRTVQSCLHEPHLIIFKIISLRCVLYHLEQHPLLFHFSTNPPLGKLWESVGSLTILSCRTNLMGCCIVGTEFFYFN
ncbi:hypothetical protein AAG906_023803 [Vitis piasezkii]